MPLVDMPLEELKIYEGINPCPDDFDAYWDTALAEMRTVDPQIELKPAEFQAPFCECFDMFFTGAGGGRIYAKLVRPRNADTPHPGVIVFHGYGCASPGWCSLLPYAAAGMTVAALDCRGQGGKSEDTGKVKGNTQRGHIIRGLNDKPEKLLFRQIFLDTAQLAGLVMDMDDVDADRVGAFGGSQGGGLTLACASLEPRIKRAFAVVPFLCDYKRVWKMDLADNAYLELKEFFRTFDPQHKREDEIFTRLGYIDVQHLAPRIKAEVKMSVGLMDTTCPPSTQFAAYNKITSKKSLVIYPDFGHEGLPENDEAIFEFVLGL